MNQNLQIPSYSQGSPDSFKLAALQRINRSLQNHNYKLKNYHDKTLRGAVLEANQTATTLEKHKDIFQHIAIFISLIVIIVVVFIIIHPKCEVDARIEKVETEKPSKRRTSVFGL
jgi:hypothetical protein